MLPTFSGSFLLAFTALLPLINPAGSALVFLVLVGDEDGAVYRKLAIRVGLFTFAFLLLIEFGGTAILNFFGVPVPVVDVSGGLVIASTAWRVLFQQDSAAETENAHKEVGATSVAGQDLNAKIFYPFTFPVTAGPGAFVTMVTLSAQASRNLLFAKAAAHAGIALAAFVLSALVYLCYGYAPKLVKSVSPATVHGILRLVAFLLFCIGVRLIRDGIVLLNLFHA